MCVVSLKNADRTVLLFTALWMNIYDYCIFHSSGSLVEYSAAHVLSDLKSYEKPDSVFLNQKQIAHVIFHNIYLM